jgi:3-deoxy-D-manno-octulosonic-acid transferase
MENFREIRNLFLEADAAVEVRDAGELVTAVDRLLSDAGAAAVLGEKARRVLEQNTGATERVLAYLR